MVPVEEVQAMHLTTESSRRYHKTLWFSRKFGKKSWG